MERSAATEEVGRRSRWILRVREWDDAKARYPNLWAGGMPRQILALDRLASRLRLGDLVAVYYPASAKYAARSERFVGLSRVRGLRVADLEGQAWIELTTLHRFDPPLELDRAPRRVLLCCDPGWPGKDAALFGEVFDAAVAGGFRPDDDDLTAETTGRDTRKAPPPEAEATVPRSAGRAAAAPEPAVSAREAVEPGAPGRSFAGAEYSGDMRDPRDQTWLAVVAISDEALDVRRLEPTGRSGLATLLRNPDRQLSGVEAIGLGVPIGLPAKLTEELLGGEVPEEGWWALVRRLSRVSRPDYLGKLQDFREAHGELRRLTDERVGAPSPLRRVDPDLGSRAYHAIRMIGEDRSRFAIRPFESAQGKLLFEVSPATWIGGCATGGATTPEAVLDRLAGLETWPVRVRGAFRKRALGSRSAAAAVVAARCVAIAVLTGESERAPEELDAAAAESIRREGWIYGTGR